MRKRFEPVLMLDAIPIDEVEINLKSRHQLPQLLLGLQHIFMDTELNASVFEIMEQSIIVGKQGRPGMNLWEILVLGVLRLNLDLDYDSLHDYSNEHKSVRGILGVETREVFSKGKQYSLQAIKDNVTLLDEELLKEINVEVVRSGHRLKKKYAKSR